jgi:hypothetical protein
MVASVTQIQSPLNFLLIQFWFVSVAPKYLNCSTFSNDLLAIFIGNKTLITFKHSHTLSPLLLKFTSTINIHLYQVIFQNKRGDHNKVKQGNVNSSSVLTIHAASFLQLQTQKKLHISAVSMQGTSKMCWSSVRHHIKWLWISKINSKIWFTTATQAQGQKVKQAKFSPMNVRVVLPLLLLCTP